MGCSASQHPPASLNYKRDSSVSNGQISTTLQQTDVVRLLGYPPVVPPTTRKKDIYNPLDAREIDDRSPEVPVDVLYSSYTDLAEYLTAGIQNEVLRVRAIFRWICMLDFDKLERSLPELPEHGTPCDYALKIKWRMGNMAHFFAQISRAAGLACLVVSGVNKSAAYKIGQPIDREAMAAQWNAVYVAGEWRLLDIFWASTVLVGKGSRDWALIEGKDGEDSVPDGSEGEPEGEIVRTVNEFFFLTDPEQLIWTHLPNDPQWQLLERPISEADFESAVYIRERFFELQMSLLPDSHRKYLVPTTNGQAVIKLGLNSSKRRRSIFRYLLFKNREIGEKTSDVPFERFVFFEKSEDFLTLTASFPVSGLFKLDLFGQEPEEHESLDLICSYLIDCRDPRVVDPLPICPDIGWGPGLEADDKGLEAISHKGGIVETEDGNVQIRFKKSRPLDVTQTLKHNQLDERLLRKFVLVRNDDEQMTIDVRLPADGQFALEIFADEPGGSEDPPNVCNYLLRRSGNDESQTTPNPFPKLHDGTLGRSAKNSDELQIRAVSHPGDVIQTAEEHLLVAFEVGRDDVELMSELQHNDISSAILSRTVLRSTIDKSTTFNIGLPKAGEYALNVYARCRSDPTRIYHVHSYLIRSTQEKRFQTEKPSEAQSLVQLVTNRPQLDIRLPRGKGELLGEFSKKNGQQRFDVDTIEAKMSDKEGVFSVDLPDDGEYELVVYEHGGSRGLQHLTTYFICRDSAYEEPVKPVVERDISAEQEAAREEQVLATKRKAVKEQLKAAMSSQDKDFLQEAIKQFEGVGSPDDNSVLSKAKRLLTYLQLSEELTVAMGERSLTKLDRIVSVIERSEVRGKLHLQLAMAKRILQQLKRIVKLRHAIMKLDQRTIAEIKSYSTPPEVVNKVMTATFLLLGEKEKHLREWNEIVVQIGKTGRKSLKRRVASFDVDALHISTAARVKEILSKLNLDEVRDVSSGAAAFYVWSKGMVEERESRFVQNGGDMSTVRAKRK